MPYQFNNLTDLENLNGRIVIVRADFNVPIGGGKVSEEFRIEKTLPTVDFLREKGAKVLLISHIKNNEGSSLKPVADFLRKIAPIEFADSLDEARILLQKEKALVLLENLRNWPGEEKNSPDFAKELASLGDIFVNEAFSASHRAHASIVSLPSLLPSYGGIVFSEEVENLSRAFSPAHPFYLILGGKKAETKTPLLGKFLPEADGIFVGGAIANDFLGKKGFNVGQSVLSDGDFVKSEWLSSPKLFLPEQVAISDKESRKEISISEVRDEDKILDVGRQFAQDLSEKIAGAKLVIWNGSMGWTEGGFDLGTKLVAEAIQKSGAYTIIGGGDTTGALSALDLLNNFSFVSTGGGAMLQFLADGILPGIEALIKNKTN